MSRSRATARTDRRRFLKLVALAGLSSSVGATLAAADNRRPTRGAAKPAATTPPADTARAGAAATPPTPPDVVAEAKALAGIVQARYGAHLTAAQLEAVTRELEGRIQGGRRLRQAVLQNRDEPDVVFKA